MNKEIIKKNNEEYYKNNKERLNEKNKCECGGSYTTVNKSRHVKSKKHQKYIAFRLFFC